MLRVLIVDDHLLIRCGLRQVLQGAFGQDLFVDEAESAEQAVEKVSQSDWDVVILDISLPGRSGLVILDDLKAIRPKLPILILSAGSEEEFAIRVLKAGAAGFIPKESTHLELVKAVKTVLAGGKHLTTNAAQILATNLYAPTGTLSHEGLSDREHQVLSMLGQGHTPTEIAKKLSLSVKTVSTYRTRILEKLNLKNTGQLIRYAIEKGLVKA